MMRLRLAPVIVNPRAGAIDTDSQARVAGGLECVRISLPECS